MRSELEIPLQAAIMRIQSEYAICEQIIARPVLIIGIRVRVTGGPVDGIGVRIVRAGEPCRASTIERLFAFPSLAARLTRCGNGPMTPQPLAGRGTKASYKPTDAPISSRDSGENRVIDNQRRYRGAVVLWRLRHV